MRRKITDFVPRWARGKTDAELEAMEAPPTLGTPPPEDEWRISSAAMNLLSELQREYGNDILRRAAGIAVSRAGEGEIPRITSWDIENAAKDE